MGKTSKNRGRSYEYRVRDWFREREGWDKEDTLRVPLSGACESLDKRVGKYDIVAVRGDVRLEIECKKTGSNKIKIQREWIDKIDFSETEFLVFALSRTGHYCLLPIDVVQVGNDIFNKEAKGRTVITLSREEVMRGPIVIHWTIFNDSFYVMPLEEYIRTLED